MIKSFTFNFIEENTYIIYSARTREAAIIDCGANCPGEEEALREFIEKEGLTPVMALQTHAHFDHVFGLRWLYDAYELTPQLHPYELDNYKHAEEQTRLFLRRSLNLLLPPAEPTLEEGKVITLGDLSIEVLHTPGHTAGSVCFFVTPLVTNESASPSEEERLPILVSGDTIFRHALGRTDLPTGSSEDMEISVSRLLAKLPRETLIYPGHGAPSTIAEERWYYRIQTP